MCGIVGFAKKDCVKDIYYGLKQLEYRGYDSVGTAFFLNGVLTTVKKKGRVEEISSLLDIRGDFGIGHTRWATHGIPSDENAHPQTSEHFALVHNGIVENYLEIKEFLQEKGVSFCSDTDTEAIVRLLEFYYKGDVFEVLSSTLSKLKGSYALAILCKEEPDRIYLARKENPLIIGKGADYNCFASDTPAIVRHTDEIYKMRDGEIAIITKEAINVFKNNKEINVKFTKTRLTPAQIDVNGFSSYMQKEIREVPQAIASTASYLYQSGLNKRSLQALRNAERIYLVGCGSAYHACLYAAHLLEERGTTVFCDTSGEFRYKSNEVKGVVVAVTQSGETSDTIGAVKRARSCGAYVIAVTNVPASSITQYSNDTLVTVAGAEIAVAATKTYNAQLIALRYICEEISMCKNALQRLEINKVFSAALQAVNGNDEIIDKISDKQYDNLFFIGRSVDYSTALEGALKVKEIAYIPSDACPAAEIKHGPLALVGKNTLVVCIMTVKRLISKTLNAVNEVKTRGADVLLITSTDVGYQNQIILPNIAEDVLPILSVIPLQKLALALTVKRGLNPDKPRNLAKSVTVE